MLQNYPEFEHPGSPQENELTQLVCHRHHLWGTIEFRSGGKHLDTDFHFLTVYQCSTAENTVYSMKRFVFIKKKILRKNNFLFMMYEDSQ